MTNQEILEKLKEFDQKLNFPMGLRFLKNAIAFMEREEVTEAKKIFAWDWDKVRYYPELVAFVQEIGWIPKNWV